MQTKPKNQSQISHLNIRKSKPNHILRMKMLFSEYSVNDYSMYVLFIHKPRTKIGFHQKQHFEMETIVQFGLLWFGKDNWWQVNLCYAFPCHQWKWYSKRRIMYHSPDMRIYNGGHVCVCILCVVCCVRAIWTNPFGVVCAGKQ